MKRKSIFTLLAAVFMVLAFSAMAFAANQVFLKTTVPNIPKSTCYQAGTDTMEFDHLSNMSEGDVIEFTLNNKVTICKAIDMFLTLGTQPGVLDTTGDTPVSTTGGSITAAGAGQQWGFVIQGAVGQQIIRLTLRQFNTATGALVAISSPALSMTFTATPIDAKLVVKLFDGKIGTAVSGFWKKPGILTPVVAGNYGTVIVAADNILCIDTLTQDYTGEYVQNTPNSIAVNSAQKLNFSGDYTIAHIMAQQQYSIVSCGSKTAVGHIFIGVQGQPDTCRSFDYETVGGSPNGYCADHDSNKLIIATTGTFEVTDWTMKLQIIVERAGAPKAIPGAYWSTTLPTAGGYTSTANACSGGNQTSGLASTYLRADGTTSASPRAVSTGSCDLAVTEKAVYLTTATSSLNIATGMNSLWIDLPPLNYDPDEILPGDVVKIRVTLTRLGCGTVGPLDVTIGTFDCAAAALTGTLTFPYFTSLTAGSGPTDWWNGIAIINTGSTAGNATITAYQKDAKVASVVVPVAAKSMYVNVLESIAWTGTVGTQSCYIVVTTDFSAVDGFGMIAKEVTGESMGYLPRK